MLREKGRERGSISYRRRGCSVRGGLGNEGGKGAASCQLRETERVGGQVGWAGGRLGGCTAQVCTGKKRQRWFHSAWSVSDTVTHENSFRLSPVASRHVHVRVIPPPTSTSQHRAPPDSHSLHLRLQVHHLRQTHDVVRLRGGRMLDPTLHILQGRYKWQSRLGGQGVIRNSWRGAEARGLGGGAVGVEWAHRRGGLLILGGWLLYNGYEEMAGEWGRAHVLFLQPVLTRCCWCCCRFCNLRNGGPTPTPFRPPSARSSCLARSNYRVLPLSGWCVPLRFLSWVTPSSSCYARSR